MRSLHLILHYLIKIRMGNNEAGEKGADLMAIQILQLLPVMAQQGETHKPMMVQEPLPSTRTKVQVPKPDDEQRVRQLPG